jgi:DNA-binding response OmpR family regulator
VSHRILLVEDELNLGRGLKLNLEMEGYTVPWATTGVEARQEMEPPPDLVILDLMLPDVDGLTILQEVKRRDMRTPVMVLTARASDEDRVAGLSLGADDYVAKPFNLRELMLRVRGMLVRRSWYGPDTPEEIRLRDAVLRPARSTLERGADTHLLTDLELRLLLHLWRRRGTWIARDELLTEVWGYSPETVTRTVDIFVSRLRRMLGDSGADPTLLLTKRGHGYMLAVP